LPAQPLKWIKSEGREWVAEMILADTSIWVQMFRKATFKAELLQLVASDQLCIHPFIIAELACGSLPNRQKTLAYLDKLNTLPVVRVEEVRIMIEARALWAKGIGYTDAQLIAACLTVPGTQIWTIDRQLRTVAEEMNIRASIQ
jgi:predicted nucleic acid-binding protein